MSITTPDDRISTYNPVVATTTFAALFPVFDNSDLVVVHDGVEVSGFTVFASYIDGVSNDAKVTFPTGLVGEVLVVGSRFPRRNSRFVNGAPLPIWQQNLVIDTLTAQQQEQGRDVDRAVKTKLGGAGYLIDADIADGSLLVVNDHKIEGGPKYAGIADAVFNAQQAAAGAALSEQNATASAAEASDFSEVAQDYSEAAAASQGQAQNLVDAAQAAYVGFQSGSFYDLGRVTDNLNLFPGDLGRVSDL